MLIKDFIKSKIFPFCVLFVSVIPLLAKIIFDWKNIVSCFHSSFGQDVYFLRIFPLVLLPICAAIYILFRNKTITMLEEDDDKKFLLSFALFLFGLTTVAIITYYCWRVSPPPLTLDDFFIGGKDGGVKPEPRESHAFIFTVVLSPLIALVSLYLSAKLFASRIGKYLLNIAVPFVWLSLFIMSYLFINSFNAHSGGADNLILSIPLLFVLSFLLTFFILFFKVPIYREYATKKCSIIFTVFSILYLFLYFMGDFFVTISSAALQDESNQLHTGLLAYPIAQAMSGIYETHQYGNYYRMIAWFVSMWSPDYRVNALLLFLGIISIIQIGLLFWTVFHLLSRKILAFLFVCSWGAVCSMEYFLVKEKYFEFSRLHYQYMPIRTLYAILSIVFTYIWLNSKGKRSYLLFLIGLLGGSAVFWNSDTGFVVLGATAVIVCAELIKIKIPLLGQEKWGLTIQFRKLLVWGTGLILAAGIMECWFSFQQHSFFNPFAFSFQIMFYQSGFCMLPMPPPYAGMWWAMLLIYALGMLRGLRWYFSDEEWSLHSKMSLFLSILGIGLFSYYQGRSHLFNLILVSYPSVLLLLIYIDDLTVYCERKSDINPLYKAIRTVSLWGMLTLVIAGLVLIPVQVLRGYKILTKTTTAVSDLQEKTKFIHEKANGRKSINVLGDYSQGFYHLATGTTCSIPQGNYTEIIMKQDVERVFQSLKNTSDPLFYRFSSNGSDFDEAMKLDVLPYYSLKGHCGNLYYYEKKSELDKVE